MVFYWGLMLFFFPGLVLFVFLLLMWSRGMEIISILVGFTYPMYQSFKVLPPFLCFTCNFLAFGGEREIDRERALINLTEFSLFWVFMLLVSSEM